MQRKALGFTAGFSKNLSVMEGHVGKVATSITGVATKLGTLGLAAGAGLLYLGKTGADFEHTLASLAAVAKPTQEELAQISKTALQVGADFGFSSIEVAKGMEAMSKQGLSTQQVIAGIGGVAAAAAADGSTLEETMGGLLATMAGMGAGADQLQHIADVMAKAGDQTAAGIGSLTQSMAIFGPTAKAMNIPIEAAVGQLALLQDAGLDASTSGTSLAAVYSKLSAPFGRTGKALKKLGLDVKDSFGNMKPPDQLMNEIFAATGKIEGNVGKAAAITELVGLESQKALLNITAAVGSGKFSKLMGDLNSNVDGYATTVAKLKQDSTVGDINKMTAAFQALQIQIFGLVSKDLRPLIQGFSEWVTANQGVISSGILGFIEGFKAALPTIVLWLERIGKVLAVFYTFAAAIKIASTAMAVFNAIMAVNPFVLLTYAIVGAIALIWAFWPEISKFFTDLWDGVVSLAKSVATAIGSFFLGIFNTVKPYIMGFVEFVVGLVAIISTPYRLMFQALAALAMWAFGYVKQIWAPISEFFAGLWAGIVSVASGVWGQITQIAGAVYQTLVAIWNPISAFFQGLWDGIASGFQAALGWVLEKVQWLIEKGGALVDLVRGTGREAMGQGGDNGAFAEGVVSPAETLAKSFSEQRSSAEVNINGPPGTTMTKKGDAPGIKLDIRPSGAW